MIDTVAKLREAFAASDGNSSRLLILPGPDIDLNPEAKVTVAEVDGVWHAYASERGKLYGRRKFATEAEVCEYVYHHWVKYDD